jgi:hypothetical protein
MYTHNPGIMPIKAHHRIAHTSDGIHDPQNLARYIAEQLLPMVRMLDQGSLKQEASVQVIEIKVNKNQPPVVEIISGPFIISKVIGSRLPHGTYTLTDFTIQFFLGQAWIDQRSSLIISFSLTCTFEQDHAVRDYLMRSRVSSP